MGKDHRNFPAVPEGTAETYPKASLPGFSLDFIRFPRLSSRRKNPFRPPKGDRRTGRKDDETLAMPPPRFLNAARVSWIQGSLGFQQIWPESQCVFEIFSQIGTKTYFSRSCTVL